MKFTDIDLNNNVFLYDSSIIDDDIRTKITNKNFVGLSNFTDNSCNIIFDRTTSKTLDLPNDCVDIYQSEDSLDYLELSTVYSTINDIYRVLKPGGLFRLSLPDYTCDILYNRCKHGPTGNICFDPICGGEYDVENNTISNGGKLWFANYQVVQDILQQTNFELCDFLHYYEDVNNYILNDIDYSLGFVSRTPDFDTRVHNPRRPLSIVVDCYKV